MSLVFAIVLIVLWTAPQGRTHGAEAIPQFTRITNGPIVTTLASPLGGAWGDYDKDGFIDLFVGGGFGQKNVLYRNNGDGTFNKTVTGDIVTVRADTAGAVWGDYDNDGNLDLFVANFADPIADQLYRGNGDGTFVRIKTGSIVNDSAESVGVAWADYDRDGWLDLFVANASGSGDLLYHNQGDGTFRRITTGPVATSGGNTQSGSWADYDNDGDPDLVVGSGDRSRNLYRNDGEGRFVNLPISAVGSDGINTKGVAWGDFDNDGDLDLVIARKEKQNDRLYENLGDGTFRLVQDSVVSNDGLSSSSASWADYDNDGWLDLIVTGKRGDANHLFHNNGDGTFAPVTEGPISLEGGGTIGSYGAAWGDYDNDGFLDLFVACSGPNPDILDNRKSFLYHNNGNANNWIMLRLVGTASNRSAIGAKVRLKATIGGKTFWQMREISGGSGWTSQDDMRVHLGLGEATKIETLRVEWPSGTVQELAALPLNKIHTIIEPPGLIATAPGRVQVIGWKDVDYGIEASADLRNWQRLGSAKGGVDFTDAEGAVGKQRFYRALVSP